MSNPVTKQSGRVSKPTNRLRDCVCSEVKNNLKHKTDLRTGASATLEVSGRENSKLFSLAVTLEYKQRHENLLFLQKYLTEKVALRANESIMDIEAMLNELLEQDSAIG